MTRRLIPCFLLATSAVASAAVTQAQKPEITVAPSAGSWQIVAPNRTVTLSLSDLAMTIRAGPATWTMMPSADDDLTVEFDGQRSSLRFLDAKKIDVKEYRNGFHTGLKIELSEFVRGNQKLDLLLRLYVCLESLTGDLICDVIATEPKTRIKRCLWPKGFDPTAIDQTVVPFMQGMLLPQNWPKRVHLYDSISYGRGLYMPWWGQTQPTAAALLILETPADGSCRFEHPPGGPTRIQPCWLHSLGKLAYPRRARICFLDTGSYVHLAKRYRRYVIETGRFVGLTEKIARSPIVARMIGSPVIHTSILNHIQPQSSYYNKNDPSRNHQLTTFDARAAELKKLAEKGIQRAYIHLDGWGLRGYDNLHPDILPPCPEAGGWDGIRRLADLCDQLGYVFALHDQYRDYYHDAASYDPNLTIIDEAGNRPFGHTWFGGNQSILCSRFAPGHVAKNHRALLANGIKVRGAYLDVFAVVPGDECHNPDHPATRAQSLQFRAQALDLIRALEGVVSSEEPADWAIPHIDLVHHAPFALDPGPGGGPAMGIPIPLYSLVYHDALLVPWALSKGGWGIPKDDWAYLHGLANAGLPYLSPHADENELAKVRTMCALHQRLGLLEMTSHQFLDPSRRRQRTTFADGTTVTIDLQSDSFQIVPPLTEQQISAALKRK